LLEETLNEEATKTTLLVLRVAIATENELIIHVDGTNVESQGEDTSDSCAAQVIAPVVESLNSRRIFAVDTFETLPSAEFEHPQLATAGVTPVVALLSKSKNH
jgi:hypothetical protein